MIQMDLSHIRQFIPLPYEEARAAQLRLAHSHLQHGDGAGGEFTGWVQLPRQYDREEFARIQAAAQKIQQRLSGAGSHRHRRLLSGRPGRHRVPVLPQL